MKWFQLLGNAAASFFAAFAASTAAGVTPKQAAIAAGAATASNLFGLFQSSPKKE